MKISKLRIQDVGGISDLYLQFNPHMNFICGPNGIGKSTVLESISHTFVYGASELLRSKFGSESSRIAIDLSVDDSIVSSKLDFHAYEPGNRPNLDGKLRDYARKLIVLKTQRLFGYQELHAVIRDPRFHDAELWGAAKYGIAIDNTKAWLVNRILYEPQPDALSPAQRDNLLLAKGAFSLLNSDYRYKRVHASSNDIVLESPDGDIYYEYLSSGFKSALSMLHGILKEVEFRFTETNLRAREFDGVVLIDELELHLHPDWQSRIGEALREMFPMAQFICTTHSPHIIQTAQPTEVLALTRLDGLVVQKQLPSVKYGFRGWSIEEVLEDVMGMGDLRTRSYRRLVGEFGSAIDSQNLEQARRLYDELNDALHPENQLRKILSLQLAAIEEEPDPTEHGGPSLDQSRGNTRD